MLGTVESSCAFSARPAVGIIDLFPETANEIARIDALAREHGLTPTRMALAWCYGNWRVASTIIGVTSLAQLEEDLDAWDTRLPPELLAAIDQVRWETRDPAA